MAGLAQKSDAPTALLAGIAAEEAGFVVAGLGKQMMAG